MSVIPAVRVTIIRDLRLKIQRHRERMNAMGPRNPRRWLTRTVKLHHLRLGDAVVFVDRSGKTLYPHIYRVRKTNIGGKGGCDIYASMRNKEPIEHFNSRTFRARIVTNLSMGLFSLCIFDEVQN